MKSLPIASLALVLALSGCASSSSLDELESRVKLLEYQVCLEKRLDYWESVTTDGIGEKALKDCADLYP
jgi:outer membrane murein-binding lipoprotein Lpp